MVFSDGSIIDVISDTLKIDEISDLNEKDAT